MTFHRDDVYQETAMEDELAFFIIFTATLTGGFVLILVKMVLNFLRDRRKRNEAEFAQSELETMIHRAVTAGTASLHERIDMLEASVRRLPESSPRALPAEKREE